MLPFNPCTHQNQLLLVCGNPNCQAPTQDTCRNCMLQFHPHGPLYKYSTHIKDKTSPFMEVITRRNNLEEAVKGHFERERRKVLEELLREEAEIIGRLDSIIQPSVASQLRDIYQGKLINRDLIRQIVEQRFLIPQDMISLLEIMEKGALNLKKQFSTTEQPEEQKNETIQQQDGCLLPQLQNPKPFSDLVIQIEESHPEPIIIQEGFKGSQNPSQQIEIVDSNKCAKRPHEIIEVLSNISHIPRKPKAEIQKLIFNSFYEAAVFNPTSVAQRAQILIDISKNEDKYHTICKYRANSIQFIRWLKKLKQVKELSLTIGRECTLEIWNIIQIEQSLLELPKLETFTINYSPSEIGVQYKFQKLKNVQVFCNLLY